MIDTGVAGSEKIIENYMVKLGRNISEIKAVFITHSHPDHIGAASAIQEITRCKIYAPAAEREWIEDINIQFRERPIPNFFALIQHSVNVDFFVKENDRFFMEDGIGIKILETAGHSSGSVSYILESKKVLFSGDAIPMADDFPILVDMEKSINSIKKIQKEKDILFCCPAWDRIYGEEEMETICTQRLEMLSQLTSCVKQMQRQHIAISKEEMERIGEQMGWGNVAQNPLFQRSVFACMDKQILKD